MRNAASDDIESPRAGWALLLPAAAFLAVFTYYPALATLYQSVLSTPKAGRPGHFVGLENYSAMVQDPIFLRALINNAWFALGTIPASIALALCMALLVNRAIPGRALVRMSYFAPTILAMVAVANIWLFIYAPQIGLLNSCLLYTSPSP